MRRLSECMQDQQGRQMVSVPVQHNRRPHLRHDPRYLEYEKGEIHLRVNQMVVQTVPFLRGKQNMPWLSICSETITKIQTAKVRMKSQHGSGVLLMICTIKDRQTGMAHSTLLKFIVTKKLNYYPHTPS